jgi:hypothetical protein
MKRYLVSTLMLLSLTLPTAAFAYVGPGAGLSLLGALWGLVAAIGTAVAFIVAWPIRKLLRRARPSAKDTAHPAPHTTNPRA